MNTHKIKRLGFYLLCPAYFMYFGRMKKYMFVLFSLPCFIVLQAQTGAAALIPAPVQVKELPGVFRLKTGTRIFTVPALGQAADLLAGQMGLPASAVAVKPAAAGAAGIFILQAGAKDSLGTEGYVLTISPQKIYIGAQTVAGTLKGIFTLLQLQQLQPDMQAIPCAAITDRPRFSYRGMHLDVSRNFYPVSFIKKYIDLMALYKFNTFHWHLTDGAGWRLQIKKYPLLTSVAAFRTHNDWKSWWTNGRQYAKEGEANAYGGYYTQEEAKDIVAYASKRGITVIPEIEMPGHSEEVLAVYPELSCTGIPYKNSEFCIGNEATFTFLEEVLTETMAIFPSVYIHVGGDEASTNAWKTCPKCQQRKKEKGLATEHELQSYLIKRIENFLTDQHRKLLGWDEILEGGLAPGATVMSWRGEKGGIEAAQQNHDVIMTPGECYLDAYQSDPNTQPEAIGGYLPLQRVYAYEPVPALLDPAKAMYIKGTQANVWTEYMPTTYQVEYMVFPRALALAEIAWSAKEKKHFDNFQQRLQSHYRLLQRNAVNYYRPSSMVTISALPDTVRKQDLVSFSSEQYQPEIHYTTDGSDPLIASPGYNQPFYTSGKTTVKAAIFGHGVTGTRISASTVNYHRAIGKKVVYNNLWSESYPAQREATLTNGIEGSLTYSDKQWLGYLKDLDITIDMEQAQPINSLSIRFMQQPGPGVFVPASVELLLSDDGVNFTSVEKLVNNISPKTPETIFKSFSFAPPQRAARYIRLKAPNTQGGFMFTDEVIIY